jgi:hypothetical protein
MLTSLLAGLLLLPAAAPVDEAHPAALVGVYDGHQMEMAAGLELQADGRFRYALSYGALDEEAAGSWVADHGTVVLTSDPVTAPRIVMTGQKAGAAGELRIALDIPAGGMTRQLFDAVISFADGHAVQQQLAEDETVIAFPAGAPPTTVMLVLPMFEVAGDRVTIDPAKGTQLRFRFEPNDLGKVDFRGTRLRQESGELLLERYGRTIHFRVARD